MNIAVILKHIAEFERILQFLVFSISFVHYFVLTFTFSRNFLVLTILGTSFA